MTQGKDKKSIVKNSKLDNNEYELQNKKLEMGMIGKFFGNKEHAPIYVSALIIFMSFLSLIAIIILDNSNGNKTSLFDKLGTPLIGLITTALGFMFGNLSRADNKN